MAKEGLAAWEVEEVWMELVCSTGDPQCAFQVSHGVHVEPEARKEGCIGDGFPKVPMGIFGGSHTPVQNSKERENVKFEPGFLGSHEAH